MTMKRRVMLRLIVTLAVAGVAAVLSVQATTQPLAWVVLISFVAYILWLFTDGLQDGLKVLRFLVRDPNPAPETARRTPSRIKAELTRLAPLFEEETHALHACADFAWTEPLTDKERQLLRGALGAALAHAMVTHDWSELEEAEHAWRATAEVAADPELSGELLAPWSTDDEVVLSRP